MKRSVTVGCCFLALFCSSLSGKEVSADFRFIVGGEQWSSEQLLSRYIQIESISGSELDAGLFIRQVCADNGLHISQMGEENGNFNFAASVRPLSDSLPNIIFLNHIDVVPPGDPEKWSYPAFSGMIIDDEIWGRGAFDNKGAAIMQLAAVVEIKRKYPVGILPYNLTFLAVSSEEVAGPGGVRFVVEHYFDALKPAVVIGEGPTMLKGIVQSSPETELFGISVAHKRPLWLKLDLEIKTSGHGSVTPASYANQEMFEALSRLTKPLPKAIYTPLNVELLKQLGALEKGITSFVLSYPRLFKPLVVPQLRKQPELFSLFSNTLTVTGYDSYNQSINSIPDRATALIDCRLLPQQSSADFLQQVRKRMDNQKIQISILENFPVMKPSSDRTVFYGHLKDAILERFPSSQVVKMFLPNFNDVGIFRAKGIPSYSSIPVRMDQSYLEYIHNFNERIPSNILKEGHEVYADFIIRCFEE